MRPPLSTAPDLFGAVFLVCLVVVGAEIHVQLLALFVGQLRTVCGVVVLSTAVVTVAVAESVHTRRAVSRAGTSAVSSAPAITARPGGLATPASTSTAPLSSSPASTPTSTSLDERQLPSWVSWGTPGLLRPFIVLEKADGLCHVRRVIVYPHQVIVA